MKRLIWILGGITLVISGFGSRTLLHIQEPYSIIYSAIAGAIGCHYILSAFKP